MRDTELRTLQSRFCSTFPNFFVGCPSLFFARSDDSCFVIQSMSGFFWQFSKLLTVSFYQKFKDYCFKSYVCSKLWMTHKTMHCNVGHLHWTPTKPGDYSKLSHIIDVQSNANQSQIRQRFRTLIWNIWKFDRSKSVASIRQYCVTLSSHAKSNCIWN